MTTFTTSGIYFLAPCVFSLTGGDVQACDVLVGDAVEVLAEATDGVAVDRDQHALDALDDGGDLRLPRRQETVLRELRA